MNGQALTLSEGEFDTTPNDLIATPLNNTNKHRWILEIAAKEQSEFFVIKSAANAFVIGIEKGLTIPYAHVVCSKCKNV
jgi:hypothetical protein